MSANVAIMVVMIVLITSIASVVRARYKALHGGHGHGITHQDGPEVQRMREEVRVLKERVAVLERIATDRNHLLEQEFDKLRDR